MAQLTIQLERIRYWQGQLLSAGDLQTQLRVDEELRRLHNRAAHRAYGIAIGLGQAMQALGENQERTKRATEIDNGKLKLPCGLAYDCAGRALIVSHDRIVDLPPQVTDNLTLVLSYDPNAVDGVALNWKPAREVNPGSGVAITRLLTAVGGPSIDLDFRPVVARPVARPRLATGNTIPGATSWQSWKIGDTEVGVQVVVDTSAVGFTRTPHFFAEALSGQAAEDLRGQPALAPKPDKFVPAWFASIANPSTQGFIFRLMLRRITRELLEIADPKRQVVETPKLDQKVTLNPDGNNALVIGDRVARLLPIAKRASIIKTLTKPGGVAVLDDPLDNQVNPIPVAFGHAPRITKVGKVSEPKSFFEVTVHDPRLFLEDLVVVKMAAPPANSRPARIVSTADDGTLELTAPITGLAVGDSLGIVNAESLVQKIDGLKIEVANPNLFAEGNVVVRMGLPVEGSASSTIAAKDADGILTLSVEIKGLEAGISFLGVAGEGSTVQDVEQNARQVEVEVENPKLFIKGDLVTKSPGSGMFVPVRVERVFANKKKLALSGPILGLVQDDFIVAADFSIRATVQSHSDSKLSLRDATRFPNDSNVAVIDKLLRASLPAVVVNSQLSLLTLAAPIADLNDGDVIGLCSFPSSFAVKDIRADKSIVVDNVQLMHEGDILSALPLRTGLAMVASIDGDVIRIAGEIPNLAIGDLLWETTIDGAVKATPSGDPTKVTVETPDRLRAGDFLADIQGWRQAWPGFTATAHVNAVTPTEITLSNQLDGLLMHDTIGLATIIAPLVELRLNTLPVLRRGDEALLVGTDRLAGNTQSLFASVLAVNSTPKRVLLKPENTATEFSFRPEDLSVGVLFVHGSALALIQKQDLFVSWLAVGEPDEMPKPCGTGAKEPESECTPA